MPLSRIKKVVQVDSNIQVYLFSIQFIGEKELKLIGILTNIFIKRLTKKSEEIVQLKNKKIIKVIFDNYRLKI